MTIIVLYLLVVVYHQKKYLILEVDNITVFKKHFKHLSQQLKYSIIYVLERQKG